MQIWLVILLILLSAVVFSAIAFKMGINYRKKIAEAGIGSAEQEAKKLIDEANEFINSKKQEGKKIIDESNEIVDSKKQEAKKIIDEANKYADSRKKEMVLEAKDEIHKHRLDTEKDLNERRKDIQRQERRLQQKEESLDKKLDSLDKKEDVLAKKTQKISEELNEAKKLKDEQLRLVETISGFTKDQAKDYLLKSLEDDLIHEKAVKIMEYEQKLKDESESKAREIISLAIQRCAANHVSEAAISVVPLPNDDMKGRIIGREGRNIRAIETATGVNLIIDDTPEAITLSSFDPVRREVARIALEKLIMDGRIHPARIEDMVKDAYEEVNNIIKQEGERATIETGINGLHPEIVKLLGRLKYRTSYGQNVLEHSLEVAYLSGIMASELGLKPSIAKRAGLLHDIGKALDHEVEGSHVELGVEVAKRFKESEIVVNAIESHHCDVEPKTIIACLVQAADAISAARPGARRENLESYIKRLEKLEELASNFAGVERCFAIQAGREVRVMVKPEMVDDERMVPLARDICKKIESDLDYPGQIKVNIIRESRAIEYAR